MGNEYDRVFLDCPPGISLLSENVFHAADFLLVPLIPTTLSVRTYEQITGFFDEKELSKKHIIPFFSMVDIRKKMHREIMDELNSKIKKICIKTIPYLSEIEKMGVYRKPVFLIQSNSKSSNAFLDLWQEILEKLPGNS